MSIVRVSDRIARIATAIAVALLVSFGAVLTTPRPVVACSCVRFTSLAEFPKANTAAFTGTAGGIEGRGVAVRVDRWFWGRGPAPTVWLAMSSFGDGAACGTAEPPPGSSWLWVASANDDGTFGTGMCSPAARLGTPEGQDLLRQALAVSSGVVIAEASPPSATSDDAAADKIGIPDRTLVAIVGALGLGAFALFGGIALVARRSAGQRRRGGGGGRS